MKSINREAPNAKEMGQKKYRERIHKESKFADDHKNLPFTFSKPKKNGKPNNKVVECTKCKRDLYVNEDTIMVICNVCKTLVRVKDKKVK